MNPAIFGKLYAHMEWADCQVWDQVLVLPEARTDAFVRESLFHIHLVQYAYLTGWQGGTPQPEQEGRLRHSARAAGVGPRLLPGGPGTARGAHGGRPRQAGSGALGRLRRACDWQDAGPDSPVGYGLSGRRTQLAPPGPSQSTSPRARRGAAIHRLRRLGLGGRADTRLGQRPGLVHGTPTSRRRRDRRKECGTNHLATPATGLEPVTRWLTATCSTN